MYIPVILTGKVSVNFMVSTAPFIIKTHNPGSGAVSFVH